MNNRQSTRINEINRLLLSKDVETYRLSEALRKFVVPAGSTLLAAIQYGAVRRGESRLAENMEQVRLAQAALCLKITEAHMESHMKDEIFVFGLRILLIFLLCIAVYCLLEKVDISVVRSFTHVISAVVGALLGEIFFWCFRKVR